MTTLRKSKNTTGKSSLAEIKRLDSYDKDSEHYSAWKNSKNNTALDFKLDVSNAKIIELTEDIAPFLKNQGNRNVSEHSLSGGEEALGTAV
jgi:hypothetical protein